MLAAKNNRVMMSQLFADVMRAARAIIVSPGDQETSRLLEKIKPFIPKFTITFTYKLAAVFVNDKRQEETSVRYFTCIDSKDSGKNRVYMSSEEGKQDLFVFYLSKDRLRRMFKEMIDESILNAYANRWIVTSGQYKFKDIFKLIFCTIAVERTSSKKNNPPLNSDMYAWLSTSQLSNRLSKLLTVKTNYEYINLQLQQYEFVKECESIFL